MVAVLICYNRQACSIKYFKCLLFTIPKHDPLMLNYAMLYFIDYMRIYVSPGKIQQHK